MAISLQNILRFAENSGQNPDGSPFQQRSGPNALTYPENGTPLIIKDMKGVDFEPNGALGLVNQITGNFVRGGAVTLVSRAVTDLVRLGKVILSPNGLAWSAAQFALSKTNPESLSSPRNRQTLPVSTLLTAGTGAAGIRFRKDGLIDLKTESGYNYDSTRGGPKYESTALETSKLNKPSFETDATGRLQILADPTNFALDHTLRGIFTNVNTGGGFMGRKDLIKEYKGGAHSTFGIGNTEIKRYKSTPYGQADGNNVNIEGYLPLFNKDLFTLRQGRNTTKADPGTDGYTDYKTKGDLPNKVKSTRINLYKMGDPGVKPTSTIPGDPVGGYGIYDIRTIDKISAASIFKRQNFLDEGKFRDYIKFKIAVVDTANPLNDNIILFRALLDNVADSFSGDWNSHKYNGRAEKFYTYAGFDRTITFGFKIHTQTRWEQKPLWRKLNYLVAQTAPEYKNRRMRGVFSRLTIGDWMNEIPGFFTSVNLSWNTAYPWEIRADDLGEDKDLNEYPHILDVSCNFQPVHNFAPSNSATTPFLLPEIGVNDNRKYAQQSDDEDQDKFDSKGIAKDAEIANINIVNVPPPPPPPEQTPIPVVASPIANDITPVENRGLM